MHADGSLNDHQIARLVDERRALAIKADKMRLRAGHSKSGKPWRDYRDRNQVIDDHARKMLDDADKILVDVGRITVWLDQNGIVVNDTAGGTTWSRRPQCTSA